MNEPEKIANRIESLLVEIEEAISYYQKAIQDGDIVPARPKPPPDNEDCPIREIGNLLKTAQEALSDANELCRMMNWNEVKLKDYGKELADNIFEMAYKINEVNANIIKEI